MATTNYPVVQATPNYPAAAAFAALIAMAFVVLIAGAMASNRSVASINETGVPQSYITTADTGDVPQGFSFSPTASVGATASVVRSVDSNQIAGAENQVVSSQSNRSVASINETGVPQSYITTADTGDVPQGFSFSPTASVGATASVVRSVDSNQIAVAAE